MSTLNQKTKKVKSKEWIEIEGKIIRTEKINIVKFNDDRNEIELTLGELKNSFFIPDQKKYDSTKKEIQETLNI